MEDEICIDTICFDPPVSEDCSVGCSVGVTVTEDTSGGCVHFPEILINDGAGVCNVGQLNKIEITGCCGQVTVGTLTGPGTVTYVEQGSNPLFFNVSEPGTYTPSGIWRCCP